MAAYGGPNAMLLRDEDFTVKFTSSGTFSRYALRLDLSGLPTKEDLIVSIDGEDMKWEPKEDLGIDRWHYTIHRDYPLSAGNHDLVIHLQASGNETISRLYSYEILEFGDDKE